MDESDSDNELDVTPADHQKFVEERIAMWGQRRSEDVGHQVGFLSMILRTLFAIHAGGAAALVPALIVVLHPSGFDRLFQAEVAFFVGIVAALVSALCFSEYFGLTTSYARAAQNELIEATGSTLGGTWNKILPEDAMLKLAKANYTDEQLVRSLYRVNMAALFCMVLSQMAFVTASLLIMAAATYGVRESAGG